jgi:hypothetical protein
LDLVNTMYPGALAAALLLGAFLCCLIILQSSKEAAIMRMLGTGKKATRLALALEQILPGIAGLAVGVCGMLLYKGSGLADISERLSLFAALYLGVILTAAAGSAVAVTRRSVLDLLKAKE